MKTRVVAERLHGLRYFLPLVNNSCVMDKKNLIFGIRPLLEAIDSGKDIDRVLVQKGLRGELFSRLSASLRQYDIPLQYVPLDRLNRISRKNHQGVIAFLSPLTFHKLEGLLPGIFERGGTPLILVLDHVTDVRNFGAIARSAECAGADAIVIPAKGAAAINEDAMKTSAGALNYIPVCRVDSLRDTLVFLKESGLKIVAASEKGEVAYYGDDLRLPLALLLGSEESGVSASLLAVCDSLVKIPQEGKIASLNVSVAAGIILFEALRQRNA